MTGIQKTIVYLNYLGLGLFAPVLSLFLLNHGCDIRTLSIVIAIYSATVIAAEVPSGMFADLRGRKKAYFTSAIFTFGGFMLMYIAHSLPVLIPGIILLGFGAAFLSGSLDSLIIEDCIYRKGDAALSEVTGAILIYQCAGIASGALINAVLPNKNGYLLHIIIRLLTLLLVVILCALFLHEGTLQRHEHNSIPEQTKIVISSLKGKRFLQIALFCVFGSSISIFALETYWQPQFSTFLTVRQDGMLGILCAVGYGGNMLGSFLASRMKLTEAKKRWYCYLLCIVFSGCGLGCIALQNKAYSFMLCYVLILTLLGAANVPEQTILNSEASNETRASLLSVASLSSKISGVFSSVICAALVVRMGISGVWMLMGCITMLVAVVAAIWLRPWKYGKSKL